MKLLFSSMFLLLACSAPATHSENSRKRAGSSSQSVGASPGCTALHQAWREEMADEEPSKEDEAALAERISRFSCTLELDIDGDLRSEKVSLITQEAKVGLSVAWGDGRLTTLGAGAPLDLGPSGEQLSDFNWLTRWEPVPHTRGAFHLKVLGSLRSFEAPTALGDGILLDGGDAAAVLFLSNEGWRLFDLGY